LIVGRSFVDMNKYVSLAEQNGIIVGDTESLMDLSIVVELVEDNANG